MSDEHICFTAIPYDGFDALLGTGGISRSGGTTPLLSDKWKERLQLAARIGVVVGAIVGLGLAFGFSIAAIVRHAHHKHHHSHALNVNIIQMPVPVETSQPQVEETPFWGTHHHHNHHQRHQQDKTSVERPARRQANQDKVTGGVSRGGFWTTRHDRRSPNHKQQRLRTHGRPNTMSQQQAQYEAFFPMEEEAENDEQDDFFPMEEVDDDDDFEMEDDEQEEEEEEMQ